jgi:hypothetical protein
VFGRCGEPTRSLQKFDRMPSRQSMSHCLHNRCHRRVDIVGRGPQCCMLSDCWLEPFHPYHSASKMGIMEWEVSCIGRERHIWRTLGAATEVSGTHGVGSKTWQRRSCYDQSWDLLGLLWWSGGRAQRTGVAHHTWEHGDERYMNSIPTLLESASTS